MNVKSADIIPPEPVGFLGFLALLLAFLGLSAGNGI